MRRFILLAVLLLIGFTAANATMTYLRCMGVDSNFTMVQGDTFTWQADCDSGADVWCEIWIDLNGNRQIDEGTDYAWQDGFVQTDGGSGGDGPGDMDGQINGEVYLAMAMGLAPGDWILRFTDETDMSSATCWGTVTSLVMPFRVISGTVSGPGGFDAANKLVELDDDGLIWQALTDSDGVYHLNLDSTFSDGDTIPLECQEVTAYVAPPGTAVVLAGADTMYGINWSYADPVAVVSGVLKDDRDSIVTGDIYIWTEPKDGGDNRSVRVDSAGGYALYFGSADVGQEWRFGVYYNGAHPEHMEPRDSTFWVNQDDSIDYDIVALYCDTYVYGTVTENGGAPSQEYHLTFWCNAGGTEATSDGSTGEYMMPISSTVDSGQGSVEIDTSSDGDDGTPLPAGYTVEGNWYKQAAPGDTVDFNLVQSSYIMVQVLQASDSNAVNNHQITLTDWSWSINNQQNTDGSGNVQYMVSAGDYRLWANDENGYIGQWYDGQQNQDDAETLRVAAGETLNVTVYLEQGSSISGRVMSEDSVAIFDHGVEIRDAYTNDWVTQASTDSTGAYILNGFTGGAYFMRAFDDHGYIGEYYNDVQDQNNADTIFINTGDNVYGYDFYLGQAVTISGYVRRDADSAAINSIQVEVKDVHTDNMVESQYTDSTGYYEFNSLGAGDFYLQIYSQEGYIGEIYNDVQDVNSAETLFANQGDNLSGNDFYLTVGATISGYVMAEDDSSGIDNMGVALYDAYGGGAGSSLDNRTTDSTGYYEFTGLSSGDYLVVVNDGGGYIGEWYDDKTGSMPPDTISVAAGETRADIDFYLASGASISGYVMDESDSSVITNIQVKLYDAHGGWLRDEQTDSTGQYVFDGLSDGDYHVMVETDQGYAGEWYDDAANQNDADTLVVSGGADVTGINLYLGTGSSLSGYVYAASDSTPINDMQVELRDWNWMFNTSTRTDTNGYYSFEGLGGGAYRLEVHDDYGYVGQWFDGQQSDNDADTIFIGEDMDTTGFDLYLEQAAYVQGWVLKDADSGAVNCEVRFENAFGSGDYSNWTSGDGSYFFTVAPGTYFARVNNVPSGLLEEEYDDQEVGSRLDTLTVAAGETLSGIDFYLGLAGVITGRLMQYPDSSTVGSEQVELYNSDWSYRTNTWSDGSGDYMFTDLEPGTYYVKTSVGWLVNQYYDGQYDTASANGVPVTAGDTVTGIDFLLNNGGYIAGQVTSDTSGNTEGISGIEVYLYRTSDTTMSVSQYNTGQNGFFIFENLDVDDYYIRADDMSGNYVNEYYDGAAGFTAANPIPMNSPPDTIYANIGLDVRRGAIAGSVTVKAGGAPVESVSVSLYRDWDDDDTPYMTVSTDAAGYYQISNLPAGSNYRIRAMAAPLGYVTQWFSNQLIRNDANDVSVYADSTVLASFELDSASTITGVVYNALDSSVVESATVALLLESNMEVVAEVTTDASGMFTLSGVPAANVFLACYAGYLGFGTVWWENGATMDSANVISLGTAVDTAGFDFYLEAAGSISGTVYDVTDSARINDIRVNVYDQNQTWIFEASTDSTGAYIIDGLVPGTYFLRVEDGDGYFGQWYGDQPDFVSADTVILAGTSDTTGFDLYLTPVAEISGQIQRAADSVQINTQLNLRLISVERGDTMTDNSWNNWYQFQDLPAGGYILEFSSVNYLDIVTDTIQLQPGEHAGYNLRTNPRMVINEIRYNGPGQDSTSTNPEYVELYVVDDVDLQNWQVTNRSGDWWSIAYSRQAYAGDLVVYHVSDGTDTTIGNVHHLHFSQMSRLDDNGGYVDLYAPDGRQADLVAYGSPSWGVGGTDDFCGWPNDGNNPTDGGATAASDVWSVSLLPDGDDRNDGSNWVMSVPTPGEVNQEAVSTFQVVSGTGTVDFDGLGVDMDVLGITGSDSIWVSVYNDSFPPNLPGGNPVEMLFEISAGAGISAFTIVVTFTYTQEAFDASDIADETSLYAARWDGGEWQPLPSTVDTGANTVTCTTTAFSLWALGGEGASVPVELASFTAQQQDAGVALAWTTASEADNLGWNVYRKIGEGAYEKVNDVLVPGAGTTVGLNSYSYEDMDLPVGCCGTVSYYLEQVDAAGNRSLSPVVTVELEQTGLADRAARLPITGLTAGPNPFRDKAFISFVLEHRAKVNLTVYHTDGTPAAVLADDVLAAGFRSFTWDEGGSVRQSGTFVYRLTVDGRSVTGRLLQAGK